MATIIENQQNERTTLLDRYQAVRADTERFCNPLEPEDYVVQSMPDASPTKWHLAHTSWFFETFILKPNVAGYESLHPQYDYLFNSYYNSIGERHCRAKRGVVSRPTVAEVYQYRRYVDKHIADAVAAMSDELWQAARPVMTLGLNHEQQHQELMVTDIKHVFSQNPLAPAYQEQAEEPNSPSEIAPMQWVQFEAGLQEIGDDGRSGFIFDNEGPRHKEYLAAFQLGSRLVTNREWLEFIDDGGYERPEFWLSEGWNIAQSEQWRSPLYWWKKRGSDWHEFTMSGMMPLELAAPVCHISLHEADAYAQWKGCRLPTEAEWEVASRTSPKCGNFAESGLYHPAPRRAASAGQLTQMFGDLWEWTRSQYSPYPGYKAVPGALGEYNGKFMCNQFVLRGGSCATPSSHIRPTYRNFFPAQARWQFTGLRLAKDI